MDNKELIKEFEEKFREMKDELGFKSTLDELDEVFFLRDYILSVGFISPKLSRMVCGRIRETMAMWINQLHEWVMPNPHSMIRSTEGNVFSEEDKEEIKNVMRDFTKIASKNVVVGLKKDKKMEAEYIDEALKIWKNNVEKLIDYSDRVHKHWEEESDQKGKH